MSQEKRRQNSRPNSPPRRTENPPYAALTPKVRRLLDGEGVEIYGARHKYFMAVVTGLLAAGWTDEQIFRELSDPSRSRAAEILRDKYHGSIFSQIRSKIGIAKSRIKEHRKDVNDWFVKFLQVCPRKRSESLVRTAAALAQIAIASGGQTFTASIRQVAEDAGLGTATVRGADTKTARNALRKLCELGFISRRVRTSEDPNEPKKMTEITLLAFDIPNYPTTPGRSHWNSEVDKCSTYIVGNCSYDLILHPLWEHAGLGFAAFRVWNLLRSRGELTVREIAESLGMATSQVRKVLVERLEEHHLAMRDSDGSWRSLDRDLDEVAEELGVLERPDLRNRAFDIQRQNRSRALKRTRSSSRFKPDSESIRVDFTTGEIIEETEEDFREAAALFSEYFD